MMVLMTHGFPAIHRINTYWNTFSTHLINQQEHLFASQFLTSDLKMMIELNDVSNHYLSYTNLEGDLIEYDLKNNRLRQKKNGRSNYITQHLKIDTLKFEFITPQLIAIELSTQNRVTKVMVFLPNVRA